MQTRLSPSVTNDRRGAYDVSLAHQAVPHVRLFFRDAEQLGDCLDAVGPKLEMFVPVSLGLPRGSLLALGIHVFGLSGEVWLHTSIEGERPTQGSLPGNGTRLTIEPGQTPSVRRLQQLTRGEDLEEGLRRARRHFLRVPALREGASTVLLVQDISITGLRLRGMYVPHQAWRFRLHGPMGDTVLVNARQSWRSDDLREVGLGFEFFSTWQRRMVARMVHSLERETVRAEIVL